MIDRSVTRDLDEKNSLRIIFFFKNFPKILQEFQKMDLEILDEVKFLKNENYSS
jgi:hypothetical protein